MNNKYSLNAESYGISKVQWNIIKKEAVDNQRNSEWMKDVYDLDPKQTWFLYDILLQEKYNHLYKREKLVNPKVGDFVYANYDGFGRGEIVNICETENIMAVKFKERNFPTLCSSVDVVTIHDNIKRKITKL